jgi:cytochrome P450
VTEYLLGEPYGGFREIDHLSPRDQQYHKLSENPFVFAIVAFSRFSLLPKWLFTKVYSLSTRLASDDEMKQSFRKLDSFISGIMSRLEDRPDRKADQTYQSRLLAAGIDPSEVAAQCKAVTFAGADSTAVILTTIIFHLIVNPSVRRILIAQLEAHQKTSTGPLDPETVMSSCGCQRRPSFGHGQSHPTHPCRSTIDCLER